VVGNFQDKVSFIWSVADKLRGPYKPFEYGQVILPMTVLRRLDCVLEPTRGQVRDQAKRTQGQPQSLRQRMLMRAADQPFYNISSFLFRVPEGERDAPSGAASLACWTTPTRWPPT